MWLSGGRRRKPHTKATAMSSFVVADAEKEVVLLRPRSTVISLQGEWFYEVRLDHVTLLTLMTSVLQWSKGRIVCSEFPSGAIQLTSNSALVTVQRTSRMSNVFLNNVESDYCRWENGFVNKVPDPEQDLPHYQCRKEGMWECYASMVDKEPLDIVAERVRIANTLG